MNETFTASNGCFARFKQRSQIHCIKISGETASADIEATRAFAAEFKKMTEDNDFPPDLVFNVDETGGFFWEKVTVKNLHLEGKKNRRLASRHPKTDLLCSLEGRHQEL